jgi:hypothetical protein
MKLLSSYPNVKIKAERRLKRVRMIRKLGGKCCKCGFSDYRGLQVDHVEGGGSSRSVAVTSRSSFYNNFYDEVMSDDKGAFQLLCANCNMIKKYETGEGCDTDLNEILLEAMKQDQVLEVSIC